MSSYKLTYFNLIGLGESIRFLLHYGNVEFEDKRIEVDSEEWKTLKPSTPFGQLPVLEIDGKPTHQHLAICRYLGKKFGLSGQNDWEDLQIDSLADTVLDIANKIIGAYMNVVKEHPNASLDERLNNPKYLESIKVVLPHLEKLDKIVKENDGFFVNKRLSWVDLYYVASLSMFKLTTQGTGTNKLENLRKLEENVLAIPAIKKWVEKRPVTLY